MKLVKGTLMGIGAVALIASLMNIVAPKAVHAAVAALVQVANTPTTAVPTVAAPAASQLYASTCDYIFSGYDPFESCSFAPVPAGQTLFIETASIFSSSTPGVDPTEAFIQIAPPESRVEIPMVQQAPQTQPGFDDFVGTVAGRIWAKGGTTPSCLVNLPYLPNYFQGGITCNIFGYLVPAQ